MTWYLQQQNHDMIFTTASHGHIMPNSWYNYEIMMTMMIMMIFLVSLRSVCRDWQLQKIAIVFTIIIISQLCLWSQWSWWSPYQWWSWWSAVVRDGHLISGVHFEVVGRVGDHISSDCCVNFVREVQVPEWETTWRKGILCILTCRVQLRACRGSWALWQKDPRRSPPQVFPEESLLLTIVMVCVKVMMAIKMF